jgi:Zn-dependent protease
VQLRLANPGFLRVAAGQVRWNAERTTVLALLIISLAGPVASFVGGLVCVWLARRCGYGSELFDFLGLTALYMFAFGCVLNLIPFTLSEGTRRRPGAAMRTDGKIILDLLILIASLGTNARR